MEKRYEWKPAARVPKSLSAQEFGALVERLAAEFGAVTPAMVLEEARRQVGTPLHEFFVWDDAVAGEQYRLQQARYLLNHLVIRVVVRELDPPQQREVAVRATFVRSLQPPDELEVHRGYVLAEQTLNDEELRDSLIEQMRAEYRAWRDKWVSYHQLWGISEAVAELDAQLSLLK